MLYVTRALRPYEVFVIPRGCALHVVRDEAEERFDHQAWSIVNVEHRSLRDIDCKPPTFVTSFICDNSVTTQNLCSSIFNSNKMRKSQSLFYLTTALHVSGVTINHLQEHKTTVTTASGNRYTVIDRGTRCCSYSCFVLLMMGDGDDRNM